MNNINYDNLYKKQWNNLYQTDFIGPRKKIVLSLFPKNKGGKNLDIGCGIGDFMLKLIKKGINIEGIDFSKEAIKNAKKKGLNVKLMDCLKLKFKDNTFSTIIAIDVLEHIKDDKKAVNEWYRVLNKNGTIIICVPFNKRLWRKDDKEVGHYRRYELKDFKKLFNKKFKIEKVRYYGF